MKEEYRYTSLCECTLKVPLSITCKFDQLVNNETRVFHDVSYAKRSLPHRCSTLIVKLYEMKIVIRNSHL